MLGLGESGLVAALDHLLVWANIVAPQTVFDGMVVRNPPRAYYTLARAALESAAQAVWVLDQEVSAERVQRHLRLLYHDLRHMAIAFELVGDELAPVARERMKPFAERPARSTSRGKFARCCRRTRMGSLAH